ncbi:hypothetical protein PHLGIDRAFT_230380 [Phlebiopsis gigantea 11061_1 CR5-6]|uniref:Transmembrane protein n=1 Tax=Phlebiopsis gigantea (strain 11061_1 CR5-6) TaxID=745531 RepID=A0A0C3SBZ1_PHLG1|nr:hypothetical protein PHLGIDRAFT_230380 [Phlebiopsis gigantea 11061_1 CR5-6]
MSTVTVVQTGTPPTLTMAEVPLMPTPPPIVHFTLLALGFFSKVFSALSFLSSQAWAVTTTTIVPLRLLLSVLSTPLIYVLSPVIVLANILAQIFLVGPYNLATAFLKAIHPIYVFVGIACIVAAAVGLCARGAVYVLHAFFISEPTEPEVVPEDKTTPVVKAEETRPRTRKKVSIKEEADIL